MALSNLSGKDWLSLVPIIGGLSFLMYVTAKAFTPEQGKGWVNPNIEKEKEKIATMVDIEDLGDSAAFCRCWRSKKFPYCDGSHGKHNKACGDNVGPLVLQRGSK